MNVSIKGLDAALKKLSPELWEKPFDAFLKRATIQVQGVARQKTPVDTGMLRNRLMADVTAGTGKVGFLDASDGSELFYQARAMEFGTGRMGDPEVSHTATHFPPPAKLDAWAARHGFASGFIVARAIARRGGLKARRMLRDGMKESLSAIQGFLKQLGEDIESQWRN